MAKTDSVYARVEPEVKEEAEAIFSELGVSVSGAINMFYRQVIQTQGLPFPMTIRRKPLALKGMTQEELDKAIQKGIDDIKKGKVLPAEEVFRKLEEKYGV